MPINLPSIDFIANKYPDLHPDSSAMYFRPNVEIGQELGFLPGGIDEKMDPYFRPITDLLEMLNEKKKISKIWKKSLGINNSKS